MSKITRVRFSKEDDIELLRLVVGENPYENPGIWKLIHSKLNIHTGKEFTLRGVKEHVEYLSKLFFKEDLAHQKVSTCEIRTVAICNKYLMFADQAQRSNMRSWKNYFKNLST